MKVNRSQVPLNIQALNESLLDEKEKEAIAKLEDPDYRWATSTHEASHAVYRLRAGASKIIFNGPHFVYDAAASTVQAAAASVGSEFTRFVSFRDMARYGCAGFIWESFLTNSPEDCA